MPNQGNDKRTFRMADEPWREFVAACEQAGVQPQAMLRTLVLWYARHPGVTVRRPPGHGRPSSADKPSADSS